MKNRSLSALLAVAALFAVPAMAQKDCPIQGAPECSLDGGPASKCDGCPDTVVTVPLQGLTEKNIETVTASLMKLGRPVYGCCPMCPDVAESKPGDCKKCGMVLELRETVPALSAAKADLKAGSVALVVSPGESLRLSQLTSALGGGKLMLDTQRLTFSGQVTLHVTGLTCGTCVKAVGGSLSAMGITDNNVQLVKKGASTVTLQLAEPVSYTSLLSSFGESKFQVADVSWTTRPKCKDCPKAGATRTKALKTKGGAVREEACSKAGEKSDCDKSDCDKSDCDKSDCDEAQKQECGKDDAPCSKEGKPV